MNLELSDISYSYHVPGGGTCPALRGVDLMVREGSCVGIIGAEGAGKTTLLFVADLLLKPDEGILSFDGTRVSAEDPSVITFRRRIGMEFQFPEQQFVAETVREELQFGFDDGVHAAPDLALTSVGLESSGILDRSPFHLSMGEARRVALAALLMRDPDLLLLDEPTAGLDGPGQEEFMRAVLSLSQRRKTMMIASHDLDFLAEVADEVAVLDEGKVIGFGDTPSILSDEGLLVRAGYERPELFRVLEDLRQAGRIPRDRFYRSREIEQVLGKESSGLSKNGS